MTKKKIFDVEAEMKFKSYDNIIGDAALDGKDFGLPGLKVLIMSIEYDHNFGDNVFKYVAKIWKP